MLARPAFSNTPRRPPTPRCTSSSFGDRSPDRIVWPDRKWEWAALRFENGDFDVANYTDLYARDKWFYQAIGASPAM
jgi:hypothetical protein